MPYHIQEKLGSGSFGCVYKAVTFDGTPCAIKRCLVPYNPSRRSIEIPRELEVLKMLTQQQTKGVTQLLGHFYTKHEHEVYDDEDGNRDSIMLVL